MVTDKQAKLLNYRYHHNQRGKDVLVFMWPGQKLNCRANR